MHLQLKTFLWIMCLIFCYIHVTRASCLSYGHSCWGAHGKRSGAPTEKLIEQIPDETANNRWEIIKILQDKNNFPARKNYRKALNLYRLGKIEETPYDQIFAGDDPKSAEDAENENNEILANSLYENDGKAQRQRKYFKAMET
ncbi:uncharacterized protein LOC134834527 [Culicoides brevitarsis]|uniref:uncharacterized protein LOC134834527 n=1 Tax=Culicoides brevitarsis TaxID=469753 RepID=UPI00307C1000